MTTSTEGKIQHLYLIKFCDNRIIIQQKIFYYEAFVCLFVETFEITGSRTFSGQKVWSYWSLTWKIY